MSLGEIKWSVVPVAPDVLGSASNEFTHCLLEALNDGDPFDQTTKATLVRDPIVIRWDDRTCLWLRGVARGYDRRPDWAPTPNPRTNEGRQQLWRYEFAEEIHAFLELLKERGALLIGCNE